MTPLDDAELRARFEALRAHDAEQLPAFGDVWRGAELRASVDVRPVRRVLVWIAAAACVVVAAVTVVVRRVPHVASSQASTAPLPLSQWRPPTATLLRSSAPELLSPQPLSSSVLDGAIRNPLQPKGD